MNSIELFSNAKINLSIDVLGEREDGYHEVEMILHEVDLFDMIHIEKRSKNIELSCSLPYLPTDEKNIAFKAAQIFFDQTGIKSGIGIKLTKRIPVSAGLGGGSSNAANVLVGLNKLFDAGFTDEELEKLGAKLGSDVPFFIHGKTSLCKGRGELVYPIDTDVTFDILIIKPDIAVSTKEIYDLFKNECISKRPLTKELVEALKSNENIAVTRNLVNVLESVTLEIYPEIREIKSKLLELGAVNSLMSGTGSAVFGIFKNRHEALTAADQIVDPRFQKYIVKTKV